MSFKRLFVAMVLSAYAAGNLCAQNVISSGGNSKLMIPRPHLQPVKSMEPSGAEAVDTIDTQSPGVKIILLNDNTWKYWRDPNDIMARIIFTEYWNNEYPDPYRSNLSELPDKINIWLVDSLGQYRCPDITKVYSKFGYRHRRRHQGVDLPLKKGDPVYAAFSGKVRVSKYYKGYGNLVIIRHENGLETFYAHLSKRLVDVDDWVEAGDTIGLGGSTGRSTGAHLHFETRYRGYAFDPQWMIDFETGNLRHRLFVLRKKYLNAGSTYVPASDEEEVDIALGDARDKEVADSIEAVGKAEAEKAAAAAAVYYKIRSGDTLSRIASRNGTTVTAICKLNPGLTGRTTLKIGRTIRVK